MRVPLPLRGAAALGSGAVLAISALSPTSAQVASGAFFGGAVNGTCMVGACPPSAAQPGNSNVTTPIDYTVTLANGDRFHVVGTMVQLNSGGCARYGFFGSESSIQYIGNDRGTPSALDTVQTESWGSFACSVGGIWWDTAAQGVFSPDIAPGHWSPIRCRAPTWPASTCTASSTARSRPRSSARRHPEAGMRPQPPELGRRPQEPGGSASPKWTLAKPEAKFRYPAATWPRYMATSRK